VPTVGVLGQTRRWFTYPVQPFSLGVTLFENYFLQTGSTITVHSDPLSLISIPVVVGFQTGNFQPIRVGQSVESSFGVNSAVPSKIDGIFVGTQLFSKPSGYLGTADGWGDLGRIISPSELLRAPGSGGLSGRAYYVVAGGDVTISPFTKATWSMICRLTGSGRNNGLLRADTMVNGQSVQVLYSNRNPFAEPKLQLSLGVSIQGSFSGVPSVTLQQFEIQSA
jgi:hypothetical protein